MVKRNPIGLPRSEGPDFVGVGMQKSGTGWVADVIAQHPGVLMRKKEINFFVRYFHKGYKWYHSWFQDKNGRMAGEFTQSYMISPRTDSSHKEFYPNWNPRRSLFFWRRQPSARDELKLHYPGVRVFAVFRNPVDRAWSAYWYWRHRKERIGKSIVSFNRMWVDDGRWICSRGLYADYLAHWRETFPDIGVFFYDDIKTDSVGLAHKVYSFIGVDDTFMPEHDRKVNPTQYEPMPPETHEMLVEFYRDQILRFSEMTGRDLSHWLEVK
ncbi:MAG: sulfotransferase [Deltaproteobacteria bacterium]|nr:sulfotransferase [Deltaproteobacteria bacterium]